MTDYDDRGAYTPPTDRLAFDPRQPVRGGGPAPVTLIVSGLVLVAIVGGVFFLYRDGFRPRGEGPSLVGAPVADVRTAAAPPAASADAGLVIDKTNAAPRATAFAPPPEASLPRPAQLAAAPSAALPSPSVPTTSALPPPPGASSTPATPVVRTAPAPHVVTFAPEAAPKPRTVAIAAPPAARAAATPAATHAPVRRAAPINISSLADDSLGHRAPVHAAPSIAAAPAPKPRAAAVAAPPKPAAAPVQATGPATGWVQIGAFSSSDLADQGWRDVARAEPDAMAGKGKAVQPLQRDGKTLYRTYVTGFAGVPAAQAFCADLKAAGKSCMVK